jgi:sulfatase modifying factor 1
MILIPGATFVMGSDDGRADEQPAHSVSLSDYFIDEFEVSNSQYQACVADGGCTQVRSSAFTRVDYRDNPEFANHPVVGASWNLAVAYCSWAGKRLPTEAEWEYAASGPDKNIWPWGNTFDPDLSAASAADTQAVDSFPDGRSAFGIYNMAGNVAEWVQDNYSTSFYAESDGALDPVMENGGNTKVFRGGSFANTDSDFYRASRRYSQSAGFSEVDIGFRCAQTVP